MRPKIFGIGVLLAVIALPIAVVARFVWDVNQSRQTLQARHVEATATIEFVYGHYSQHQEWPSVEQVSAAGVLPPQWKYDVDSMSAAIWLNGSYHMAIYYRFMPPQPAVSRTWTLSFEGDKTEFAADADYQPRP